MRLSVEALDANITETPQQKFYQALGAIDRRLATAGN